jgi:hypothetical protein
MFVCSLDVGFDGLDITACRPFKIRCSPLIHHPIIPPFFVRTLIIPDLHNHVDRAEFWISEVKPDHVVFLGDYFDDFGDNPEIAESTATWIRNAVESHLDWTFLLGNHDMPYLFPFDERFLVPGFSIPKQKAIGKAIRAMDRSRFKLHTWVGENILVSHAGLHSGWLYEQRRRVADKIITQAEQSVLHGKWHALLSWGQDRGGMTWQPSVGGIIWADWSSLEPLPFCHQIVGPTPGRAPRHRTLNGKTNLCIDINNGSACAVVDTSDGRRSKPTVETFVRTGESRCALELHMVFD